MIFNLNFFCSFFFFNSGFTLQLQSGDTKFAILVMGSLGNQETGYEQTLLKSRMPIDWILKYTTACLTVLKKILVDSAKHT